MVNARWVHRHQLAHQMAGFLGHSWSWRAVAAIYKGLSIDYIERDPNYSDFQIIFFHLDAPNYGASNWHMAVKYDKMADSYEQYCSLDPGTLVGVWRVAERMRCHGNECGWRWLSILDRDIPASYAMAELLASTGRDACNFFPPPAPEY